MLTSPRISRGSISSIPHYWWKIKTKSPILWTVKSCWIPMFDGWNHHFGWFGWLNHVKSCWIPMFDGWNHHFGWFGWLNHVRSCYFLCLMVEITVFHSHDFHWRNPATLRYRRRSWLRPCTAPFGGHGFRGFSPCFFLWWWWKYYSWRLMIMSY